MRQQKCHSVLCQPHNFALLAIITLAAFVIPGCAAFRPKLPATMGEQNSGFTYVPMDPLPVVSQPGVGCRPGGQTEYEPVLRALPDNAVRIAIGSFDVSGQLTFGPVKIGTSGNSYQVVLDHINVDTANVLFDIWYSRTSDPTVRSMYSIDSLPADSKVTVVRFDPDEVGPNRHEPKGDVVVIPVYVGLGLRLTANVNVLKGSVNLSSLGTIAAEAQTNKVSGSLVVQTLGITGPQVMTSLPLPSELNPTTIQNAILSLGAIKAILHDTDAIKTPRVTGIHNSTGISDQRFINAIVSELAKKPIDWNRACVGGETR